MNDALKTKYESLQKALRRLGSLAVGFSGGVDSTFLVKAAHDILGDRVLAVTASSETYPSAELEAAKALAAQIGAPHVVIETSELGIANFRNNPPDRCYHCKYELFSKLRGLADARGIEQIADGSNADDIHDYRPGARAAKELGVLAPLRDAGLTKADIRELSREAGLPTWDKPAYACLASRFPYGDEITAEKLHMIEQAERLLRELGLTQCRVRHHGELARIEVEPEQVERLASRDIAEIVARRLKELGFRYVTLDLEGYRMGSMNEALRAEGDGNDRG